MIAYADRVMETTTTTGTGTVTLAGAVTGHRTFGAALSDADQLYYAIESADLTAWEVGIGTYTASGTTLSRDTILASTNSNSAVNFGAGTKRVFLTVPAHAFEGIAETGDIRFTANAALPTGWLLCDASNVSRSTYARLFAVIGETFGAGDGSTTFTLPNDLFATATGSSIPGIYTTIKT